MGAQQKREIRCPVDNVLFGVEVNGVLSVKNRDLYRTIEGGRVSGPCRGCGNTVVWEAK
jgi:hypothetical protein